MMLWFFVSGKPETRYVLPVVSKAKLNARVKANNSKHCFILLRIIKLCHPRIKSYTLFVHGKANKL